MEVREEKVWQRFKLYFKFLTGVDIGDESIVSIDPLKIKVSEKWNEECLKMLPELEEQDRVIWGLFLLNGSPKIVRNQEDSVIFEDDAIKRRT